jgi:uncharacterized membrane protein
VGSLIKSPCFLGLGRACFAITPVFTLLTASNKSFYILLSLGCVFCLRTHQDVNLCLVTWFYISFAKFIAKYSIYLFVFDDIVMGSSSSFHCIEKPFLAVSSALHRFLSSWEF